MVVAIILLFILVTLLAFYVTDNIASLQRAVLRFMELNVKTDELNDRMQEKLLARIRALELEVQALKNKVSAPVISEDVRLAQLNGERRP